MNARLVSGGQSEITYVAPMLKTMSFFLIRAPKRLVHALLRH